MKDVEYGLKVETGFINDESKFYTGFCAALNTYNGHVLMIATTVKELEIQSKLVINSDFELNGDMVSRVGLCKEKHITKTECKESKEMNEHILLVMKYLDDKNSVSKQELKESANAANAAYAVADAAAAVAADAAANAAAYAANAAANAANAAYAAYAVAEKWINRYFDHTKEDKQTYIDAINAGKESKEMIYTQAMRDKGQNVEAGMSCQAYIYAETKNQGSPLDNWVDVIFQGKCKSSNNGYCYLVRDREGINHVIRCDSHIAPVDTRTDEEKAVDDLKESYDRWDEVSTQKDAMEWMIADIKAGRVHGVSFTGDKK